jgi:ligand-binding sensor domain-containing protein
MCNTYTKKQRIQGSLYSVGTRMPFVLSILLLLPLALSACAPGTGILGGGNWQLSGLQHQHIRAFDVDFKNAQILYAGDAQNGVFVTTDGGQHWVSRSVGLPLPDTLYALSFDATGKKLYIATAKGIFVSADAAQHWNTVSTTRAALPVDSYTALAFDTTAPHTIYAGTAHHGVLLSTNDGATWSTAGNGLPAAAVINGLVFDSDQHQLWAATALGVYRSDDKGTTWQALNSGLPPGSVVNVVRVASMSGGPRGLVYAGANQGFFRSTDSGIHWMPSKESLSGTSIRAILVDFHYPSTVYIGTDAGAFRSDDSGQNWGGIGPGLPRGQSVYAFILGATNYSQLFAAVNDVYLYPGASGGISLSRLVPLLLLLLMFYLLYRVAQRGRNRRRNMLKPERISETSSNSAHPSPLTYEEKTAPPDIT